MDSAPAPPPSQEELTAVRDAYQRVNAHVGELGRKVGRSVDLIAVSKLKSVDHIMALYNAGHRAFGENYVQELVSKAEALPGDIQWHFIGTFQSNKAKQLCAIPNLHTIETVYSSKGAGALETACAARTAKLRVFVQVNTSGEDSKSGAEPTDAPEVVRYITSECPRLQFAGLMTIGSPEAGAQASDFQKLVECRAAVCQATGLQVGDVGLSMGMSADYELAIESGSTNVRVGSTIFGARSAAH